MNELSERLRRLMKDENLKQSDLARILETTPQNVYNWLTRGSLSKDKADKLCEIFGYSVMWLLYGKGAPKNRSDFKESRLIASEWEQLENKDGEFVEVPLIDVELSAGHGSMGASEQELYTLPFRAYTLHSKGIYAKDVKVVRVMGDSMEPKLSDGDVVAINTADRRIRDGKIYAIRMGDVQKIKILIQNPDGSITVRSYNPDYKDETIADDKVKNNELIIIGRVWWISSLL